LQDITKKFRKRIARLEERLQEQPEWKEQKKKFGHKANLGSDEQLGYVLYEIQDHEPIAWTPKAHRPQLNEAALIAINTTYTKNFLKLKKLKKLEGTYLTGIAREVADDGFLRPFINLHIPVTYRSSCDSPNFQNIPIRDSDTAQYIRRAFIPRKGRVLVEVDLKANEVRVAACYHKDPTMIEYLENDYDLHLDMASKCFKLKRSEVTKGARFIAKNTFVFAAFYGSYYVDIARNMWEAIKTDKLTRKSDDVCLYDHLLQKGIVDRGECKVSSINPNASGFHLR